jgi:magnesium transporter
MLTQEVRQSVSDITELNQLKSALNRLPAVDAGDYIAELPAGRRAIAFRQLNKAQAIDVFEYLPPEVQEELIN